MSSTRRHTRIPYNGPVRISWEDDRYQTKYAVSKCVDVSEAGLRIEVPEPIPVGTYITLRADRINVSGSASVKNVTRTGTRCVLGLELSSQTRNSVIEKLSTPAREPIAEPATKS